MSDQQEAAWSEAVELINSAQLADAPDKVRSEALSGADDCKQHPLRY